MDMLKEGVQVFMKREQKSESEYIIDHYGIFLDKMINFESDMLMIIDVTSIIQGSLLYSLQEKSNS